VFQTGCATNTYYEYELAEECHRMKICW